MKHNSAFVIVHDFIPDLIISLPETYALLTTANLVVHPLVSQIVLHGSRGPAGGFRLNSDIDLSLIAEVREDQIAEPLFNDITRTTLDNWQPSIEVDLAVIFDRKKCGLNCFEQRIWTDGFCQISSPDCFGLFKIQKGFNGFVTDAGIQVKLMYPCMKIWQRIKKET